MLSYLNAAQSDFHLEVYRKTYALISTLRVLDRNDLESNSNYLQDIPLLGTDISLALEGFDAKEIQKDREQLVYRGWIDSIYQTWEETRNKMKKSIPILNHDVIDQVMGDIRLIRNTLIHCSGIVGKKGCQILGGPKSEGCKSLKWFGKGDKVVLEMRHILDIMHHMGVLRCQNMQFHTQDSSPSTPKKHIWGLIENRDLILKFYRRKIRVIFEQVVVDMYKLPCTIPLKIREVLENAHGSELGGVQLDYQIDNEKVLDSHPQDVKYGYKNEKGSFQDADFSLNRGDTIEFYAQIDRNGYVREIFTTKCNS